MKIYSDSQHHSMPPAIAPVGKKSTLERIRLIKKNLMILLFLPLLGCSDFLEQEPGSQVSITEQLGTYEGIQMALTGAYGSLESLIRSERFAVYADLQGGNLKFTPRPSGSSKGQIDIPSNIQNVYGFDDQAESSDFVSFYDDAYDVINQANLIIEYVDLLDGPGEPQKKQVKAEALAIRAYAHYVLSLIYSQSFSFSAAGEHPGIVYQRASLSEVLNYPERSSLQETYELIVQDMEAALSLFQGEQALPGPSYSYFNRVNLKALLARIYLSQNQWQQAFDTAQQAIEESGLELVPTSEYVSAWEDPTAAFPETLLELTPSMDQEGAIGGSLAQYFGYQNNRSYGDYVATEDLLQLFEQGDVRGLPMFLEISLPSLENEVLVDKNYYFTKKFQDSPGLPLIRLSELYLIKAEAAFELGNFPAALDHLNVIRERANASLLTSETELLSKILEERRRELNFEGHLFFDLARQEMNIDRNDGCLAVTCDLSYPSPKFILPIPQKNINLNQNLEQNESY